MTDDRLGTAPVALVTGGARGIGAAICEALVDSGVHVAINYRSSAHQAAALVRTIEGRGGRAIAIPADVSDPAEAARLVDDVVRGLGRLDILVNNAALTDIHKPWSEVTPDEFWEVLKTNLAGPFHCIRSAYPYLRDSGRGRIINISSTSVLLGSPNMMHYITAKSGMIGLTRSLAREMGPDAITVNTVTPGAIQTEAELESFPDQAAVAVQLESVQSIKRRGLPADVANAIRFLASEEASFITGQLINIDGGWAMH